VVRGNLEYPTLESTEVEHRYWGGITRIDSLAGALAFALLTFRLIDNRVQTIRV